MSRKQLELKHHLASGCCMWSTMEDVYATKTAQDLPEAYFIGISSLAETALIKMRTGSAPYMFSFVDARPHKTYENIRDLLCMEYKILNRSTPEAALTLAKREIDDNRPVVIGPIDMYHLPYLKIYHRYHAPIHFITMIGYDEEANSILITDCDRTDPIELPLANLYSAWQVPKNAMGDKNGLIRFTMSDILLDQYELAEIALPRKAERQLCEKPSFIGINAYERIASLLPVWQSTLSTTECRNIIAGLPQFFGMVPKSPNRLLGIPAKDEISYQANYDRFGAMLIRLGAEGNKQSWRDAGENFLRCGILLEEIKDSMVRYCCNNESGLGDVPTQFRTIASLSREAYTMIKEES